nr:MAG TPA: hypothetical protein [Caudoviricetes sp.]
MIKIPYILYCIYNNFYLVYSSLVYFDRGLTSRRIIIPKKLFRRILQGASIEHKGVA